MHWLHECTLKHVFLRGGSLRRGAAVLRGEGALWKRRAGRERRRRAQCPDDALVLGQDFDGGAHDRVAPVQLGLTSGGEVASGAGKAALQAQHQPRVVRAPHVHKYILGDGAQAKTQDGQQQSAAMRELCARQDSWP